MRRSNSKGQCAFCAHWLRRRRLRHTRPTCAQLRDGHIVLGIHRRHSWCSDTLSTFTQGTPPEGCCPCSAAAASETCRSLTGRRSLGESGQSGCLSRAARPAKAESRMFRISVLLTHCPDWNRVHDAPRGCWWSRRERNWSLQLRSCLSYFFRKPPVKPVNATGQVRRTRSLAGFRDQRLARAATSSASPSEPTRLGSKSSANHSANWLLRLGRLSLRGTRRTPGTDHVFGRAASTGLD
jgi:hypothetical protein